MGHLATALLIVLAFVADAQARVRVEAIDLVEVEGEHLLHIATSRPANYTSFTLDSPPRVVLDFPEAAAEPATRVFPSGPFAGWRVETHEDVALVRLTIELRSPADYLVRSTGQQLKLRLVPVTARPIATLEDRPLLKAPVPSVSAAKTRAAEPRSEPDVEVAVIPPAPIEESPAEVELMETTSSEESPATFEVEAVAEFDGPLLLPEEPGEPETPSAPVEAVAEHDVPLLLPEEPDESKQPEPSPREEVVVQVVEEAKPLPEPDPRMQPSEKPSFVEKPVARKPVALQHLAFRVTDTGPRVTVRTSGEVGYAIREESPTQLVVLLEPAHIPVQTNRLPLDTRFFDTVVLAVRPVEVRNRVRLEIDLAQPVAYQARQEDGVLLLDFAAAPSSVSFPSARTTSGAD